MSEELKPCPFCGHAPMVDPPLCEDEVWVVVCANVLEAFHEVLVRAETKQQAIQAWNQRIKAPENE